MSILKFLKINYVLPGSLLYQPVIFSASTGIISGEIRLLIAKLWLTHRRVTFIKKKNHVANLPEKDSNCELPNSTKKIENNKKKECECLHRNIISSSFK